MLIKKKNQKYLIKYCKYAPEQQKVVILFHFFLLMLTLLAKSQNVAHFAQLCCVLCLFVQGVLSVGQYIYFWG